MSILKKPGLISHNEATSSLKDAASQARERILQAGDQPHATVAAQLDLLEALQEFDFGRFLLQNQGINGYWTHYMLTHPMVGRQTGKNNQGQPFTSLEKFLLDEAPTMLATQQRFNIFLQESQEMVKEGAVLASIPCGLLAELLYLDFSQVSHCRLIGIDFDQQTLKDAETIATEKKLTQFTKYHQENAWSLKAVAEYDLITSNGLTIYEPDDEQVAKLYKLFYQALKPGGKLVTSFLTPPPGLTAECEWNMAALNKEHLLLQQTLFANIINAKFRCFRSSDLTKQLLMQTGFHNIKFIYDKAHLFPTVVAYKEP
ncbi:Exported protein [Legionella beliardensis]|uniref:Exported protein n=1 Tax=Legionella beliardensis TaxID=91822 RepID=A0A378I6C1_9GAMM|nr:class I SAM-dependent methyltransferase [Legionella beliardensis]STX30201.1 Exported protein [Legionella beliardensis]